MISWPGLCAFWNNDLVFCLPFFFFFFFLIWFDHQAESGIYKNDTRNLLLNVGLWSTRYPHASHAHGTIMEGVVSEGSKSAAVSWEKLLRKYSLSESVGKRSRCRMWECSEARLFLEGWMSTQVWRATGWRLGGWSACGGLDVNTSLEGNRVEAWRVECMWRAGCQHKFGGQQGGGLEGGVPVAVLSLWIKDIYSFNPLWVMGCRKLHIRINSAVKLYSRVRIQKEKYIQLIAINIICTCNSNLHQ